MKVGEVICVTTFMICVHDKCATLLRTCPGLCRKVGVMEFGLNCSYVMLPEICRSA